MNRRTFLRGTAGASTAMALSWGVVGCTPTPDDPFGVGPHPFPVPSTRRDLWARMPAAFNHKVTTETSTSPLRLLSGGLPSDMAGHVFFQSLSLGPDDVGFAGDALIWRVDFDGEIPHITSKILRTTDYLMSQAFADTQYRFEPRGMMRLGPLGLQNQTNTALVALDGNRLIATIDGGRPWELDPATLDPLTPVGRLDDYRAVADLPFNRFLCPMNITSAHPPYDPHTGEYYGVSLSIVPIPGMIYFEVLAWNGSGSIKRVPVYIPDGTPLLITQNAHQICVTRHHLVIVDASGTIESGKLINDPNSHEAGDVALPRPESYFYIINRDQIRSTTGSVVAQRAIIPRESGHFMVDYDSTPDRLVIHSPHTSASDFAEWIQPYDIHPLDRSPVRPELVNGITPVNYDIGVVGRYEVNARDGRVLDSHVFYDDTTWGTGGLTARNPLKSPGSLGDLYHANSGFPTDLAVERVSDQFKPYPYRIVPYDDLPWGGVPSSLVRIDHDAGRVVDSYFFPGDRFGWTVTFVPRHGTGTGSDDGYIVALVYGDHATENSVGTELWIFRADDLAHGPIARLGRPDLQMPLAIHSVWLNSTRTSRPDYRVDVRGELLERAQTWVMDPQVESILRTDVLDVYESIIR